MRSYTTARSLFSFVEFVAWTLVVAGLILALMGAGAGNIGMSSMARGGGAGLGAVLGALPGVFLAVLGLFLAAYIQTSRASVDSAEIAGRALKISEEQLRLAKEARQSSADVNAPQPVAHKPQAAPKPQRISVEPTTGRPQASAAPPEAVEAAVPVASASVDDRPKFTGQFLHGSVTIQTARDGRCLVDGRPFATVDEAKAYARSIDQRSS